MTNTYKIEQFFLKFTMGFDLLAAILCACIGLYVNSSAIIFDSIYCFFLVFGSFLLVIISKKMHSPPNSYFQYGYDKFEPLMIFIQSGVIVVSCIYAFLTAISDIIHPTEFHNYEIVVVLEFVLFLSCFIMFIICQYYAHKCKSRILELERLFWLTDSFQSLIICSAFLFGLISESIQMNWIAPYVDPIALIFLVVSIIKEPAYYFKISLLELLDGVSPGKTFSKLESSMKEFLIKRGFEMTQVSFRKSGKKLFIKILFIPNPNINAEKIAKVQHDLNNYLKTTLFNYSFEAILVVDDRKID